VRLKEADTTKACIKESQTNVGMNYKENTNRNWMTVCFRTATTHYLVNSKLYNSKSSDISNFSLNLGLKEEKFIQICLVTSKTLIIHNSKEKSVL
jgi:hypothetical protein